MSAVLVGDVTEPPRVAYAVSRRVGNAVVRNRVRRRIRAVVRESSALLRPGWAYLVVARPEVAAVSYGDLLEAITAALSAHLDGASV